MESERHRGLKRRREAEPAPADDLDKPLLSSLIHVCNLPMEEDQLTPDAQLDSLFREIVRGVERGPSLQRQRQVEGLIIGCATEMSHKTPIYAAVLGLVNTQEPEFVQGLVRRVQVEFDAALAAADCHKARMLLRLMAALVPSNVVHASSVLKAMQSIVDAAKQMAEKGGTQDEQRVWQPYTDYLVYIVLMALPWGGSELAESVPADLQKLLADVKGYMGLRPRSHQPALRPFFEGDDEASKSDSGAASFLGQVWEAVQEMQSSNTWKVENIPVHVTKDNEVQLATGQPHDLPSLTVPLVPPCIPAGSQLSTMEAAAAVLAAFPPRGVIRMLPPEHTMGGKPKIERLVAEEYILDTIHFYNGDRVECARTLASGLPLPIKSESLLAEMLFSQMLRVPSPHLKPIAYSTIMVDVCKLMQTFPRSMSACVRECFTRMAALDPQLRVRLADWLAYHLSNFDFMWPWAKWSHVLQAPPYDAQRRFVVATLSKLIRLSYWGNVQSKVPDAFKAIVPPKPEPQPLVPQPAAEASADPVPVPGKEQDGDQHMQPAADALRETGVADRPAPVDQQGVRAAEFTQMIRSKASTAETLEWVARESLEDELGGKSGVLCMVLRALLVAGSKSFTHMITALERCDELLMRLLADAGAAGQKAMVRTTAEVWKDAPQRAAQAIDRLMAHRVVDGLAILRWAFDYHGLVSLQDELATGLVWEVIYNAVNKTLARTQDAREELAAAQQAAGIDPSRANGASAANPTTEPMSEEMPELALEVEDTQQQGRLSAVTEKEDLLMQAQQDQQNLFLLAFELFRDVLGLQRSHMIVQHDEDAEKEWRSFMIASLRAFTRRYYNVTAALAPVLEGEIFAQGKVDDRLRQAFVESLHI